MLAGCSYDTVPPTFADGSQDIAEAFCERRVHCGFTEPPVDECEAINMESLCMRYDCDKELTDEQEEMFAACVEAFEQW